MLASLATGAVVPVIVGVVPAIVGSGVTGIVITELPEAGIGVVLVQATV